MFGICSNLSSSSFHLCACKVLSRISTVRDTEKCHSTACQLTSFRAVCQWKWLCGSVCLYYSSLVSGDHVTASSADANYPSEICPLSSVSFLSAVSAIDYLDLYRLIRHNEALSFASTEKICYHVINPQWCKQTPDSRHRHLSLHCHRGTPLASIKRRQELDRLSHDNVHTRTHMTPRMLLFSSVLWWQRQWASQCWSPSRRAAILLASQYWSRVVIESYQPRRHRYRRLNARLSDDSCCCFCWCFMRGDALVWLLLHNAHRAPEAAGSEAQKLIQRSSHWLIQHST